jgi:hypothetical protein
MELFSRIRPTASWLVLLVAVFVLLQSPLLGQQATGNVTGIAGFDGDACGQEACRGAHTRNRVQNDNCQSTDGIRSLIR